ncbi:hypothetical protein KBC89_00635 [Candidatus Woesebacteria bacterium]|nr:hypothetical protein [Candidatus Woesebacteria bacterium]
MLEPTTEVPKIPDDEVAREVIDTPEAPSVAQFLSVIRYDGNNKGLLVTLADGSVKFLELDQPESSVENYLLDQLKRQQISIDQSSLAAFQLKAMLMDADDQLPLVEAPKCKEIRAKYIEINTTPEYVDSARVADTIVIPIVEDNQIKEFLSTVKALAQALVDAQLSEAKGNNCLLLPFQGDLTVDSPRVTILLAGLLTDEHQPKVDLSVPAGEKVLKMIVTLLMNDVAPRNGGQREPYIERLVTYCEITPQEFCEEILKQISVTLQENNVGKFKIFMKLNSIRGQLQTNISSVQAILDAAKSGLTEGDFIKKNKPDDVEELVLKATSSRSLSILLETMLGNALVDESGIRYKPAGILEAVRELGGALLGNELVPEQIIPEPEQFPQPTPKIEPIATPVRSPAINANSAVPTRPSFRERLFGTPKAQLQKMEIPQSTYGEIGNQIEMRKANGTKPWITEVFFNLGSRWPVSDGFGKSYTGPDMLISIISNPQESSWLSVESSADLQIQVNGEIRADQHDSVELKPGDIITIIDKHTFLSSTFVYGFTKKFELLKTNQVETPSEECAVPAVEMPGNVEGFTILGYVITDELNRRNNFTDYPQFNKTITWGDFASLDYHCGMSFSRKLTIFEKKVAGYTSMALVATSLQGSLPLIPIQQSQELSIGSHVIAEDRQHNTISHLKVLASGLIVTYTEKRSTTAQASPAREQTKVEPKQSDTPTSGEKNVDVTFFDKPQNAEFGPRIPINLLKWSTESMSFDDTAQLRLIAFGDPSTKLDQVEFNRRSLYALTLMRKHNGTSADRELRVSLYPEASVDHGDSRFSVNGKLWDKRGQFSIQPGDTFSVSEPISGIRSTFMYDYLGMNIELLQTEAIDGAYTNRVKPLEAQPHPCDILGYIGKVSRTTQRPGMPDNFQKDIHWAETAVKVLSEADRYGTHIAMQLVNFDFGKFSFILKKPGKSQGVPIHSQRYLPEPGDQIEAVDKKTNKKYILKIHSSGLIISYVEDQSTDPAIAKTHEMEPDVGEMVYFKRSFSAEVGASLKFSRIAPPTGEKGIKQFVLNDQEVWPFTTDIGEIYDGPSMTIELHSFKGETPNKFFLTLSEPGKARPSDITILINGGIWTDPSNIPLHPGDVVSFRENDSQKAACSSFVLTRLGTLEFVNSNQVRANKTLCVENEFSPIQKPFEAIGYLDGGEQPSDALSIARETFRSIYWNETEYAGAFIDIIGKKDTTLTLRVLSNSEKITFERVISTNPWVTAPLQEANTLERGAHVIVTDVDLGVGYHLEILQSGLVVKYTKSTD